MDDLGKEELLGDLGFCFSLTRIFLLNESPHSLKFKKRKKIFPQPLLMIKFSSCASPSLFSTPKKLISSNRFFKNFRALSCESSSTMNSIVGNRSNNKFLISKKNAIYNLQSKNIGRDSAPIPNSKKNVFQFESNVSKYQSFSTMKPRLLLQKNKDLDFEEQRLKVEAVFPQTKKYDASNLTIAEFTSVRTISSC